MNVLGLLRVRNESRWIERCLRSIQPLCNAGIILLDDHSTDDTAKLAAACGARVVLSPYEGLNEARDKNLLLDLAANSSPDWCVMIDGDEAIDKERLEWIKGRIEYDKPDQFTCLSLPIRYLWDSEDQIRVDGVYGDFRRESVFRFGPGRFEERPKGPNFHCGNVPPVARKSRGYVEAPILHYGYIDRETRIRKYNWYNERDPNNEKEDRYRHMVIGDIFPANSRLHYGGPLELRKL